MIHNQYVLKRYLDQAVSKIRNVKKIGGKWQFFCNVCGDDVDRGNRNPRGALFLANIPTSNEQVWMYKCFNGGCVCNDRAMSASYWLSQYYPDLYSDYCREMVFENMSTEPRVVNQVEVIEEKKHKIAKDYKFTSIIRDGDVEKIARDYCISRKIPESIWKEFKIGNSKPYTNRLIIPFYDKKGLMYYFQARSLFGEEPKYLNPVDIPKQKGLYNVFGVNWKKDVIVTEGPIDSMFVPNAIAVTGASIPTEVSQLLEKKSVLYLWDNDEAGWKNAKNGIKHGKRVFLWKKFLSDNNYPLVKDINKLITELGKDRFTEEELYPYFSDSVFDSVFV